MLQFWHYHACLDTENGFYFGIHDNGKILYVSIVGDDDTIAFVVDALFWVKSALILEGQHVVMLAAMAGPLPFSPVLPSHDGLVTQARLAKFALAASVVPHEEHKKKAMSL
ncbi:hypothetical protein Tco_1461214, partial [Tanacetum coccineum]